MAAADLPKADLPGARDTALLKRYEGSFIVAQERQEFGSFTLPLAALAPVADRRDARNNRYFEPKQSKPLEGAYTRLVYLVPEGRSPLEVLRNYEQEVRGKSGKVLFRCTDAQCGGSPVRASAGGGGQMSLAMFLYPHERVKDALYSNGWCAMMQGISGQQYLAAELPGAGHVSVLAYTLHPAASCKVFDGRTVAIVDIVEAKQREQRMVTVSSAEMAQQIAATGSVALYGILFDSNKTEVKPESAATLAEIARLLAANKALKLLVVGHTDHVGTLQFNMDLSQRRAAAVVEALVTKHGADKARLTPMGIGYASPVAANATEEGRAKNRRVELVEN